MIVTATVRAFGEQTTRVRAECNWKSGTSETLNHECRVADTALVVLARACVCSQAITMLAQGGKMHRRSVLLVLLTVLGLMAYSGNAYASTLPTGERSMPAGTLEPVYDAAHAGRIGYVLTPEKAPMHAPPVAWAPIYVPVYPVGTTAATTFSCMHLPVENCPSHGDGVAGAAAGIMPSVYGDGVVGHDHVLDFPSGDDFNFAWEPVLVLFTSKVAANQHLLTDAAILAARDAGQVVLVPVAALTFNCAVVPRALWDRATPVV